MKKGIKLIIMCYGTKKISALPIFSLAFYLNFEFFAVGFSPIFKRKQIWRLDEYWIMWSNFFESLNRFRIDLKKNRCAKYKNTHFDPTIYVHTNTFIVCTVQSICKWSLCFNKTYNQINYLYVKSEWQARILTRVHS